MNLEDAYQFDQFSFLERMCFSRKYFLSHYSDFSHFVFNFEFVKPSMHSVILDDVHFESDETIFFLFEDAFVHQQF